MKNIILALCLLLSISAGAAEINFLDNPKWETVLEKAKKENKLIFLDAYATWCGPCKNMDAVTYKDQAVADYYNANFINVKYDMEKGEGPMLANRFFVTSYPTLAFIDFNGVMVHKGIGFREAADFVELGKQAKDPSTQYYTIKKKALELSSADFIKFAMMAAQFQDEDFSLISNDYLAKQKDILGDTNLIDLVMNGVYGLPDEKALAYFAANKSKVINTGKYSADDFDNRLINLTLQYSISEDAQPTEDVDFSIIKTLLDKYVPEKSFFVYHYFKAQYLLDNQEAENAATEFDILLSNTPEKVNFDQLCNAMLNFAPKLEKSKLASAITKFEAVKVTQQYADLIYMKDFVKAVIYIKTSEFDKFKPIAASLIASKDTPEDIKKDLKLALENLNSKKN